MARKSFYSFHFKNDAWRASQVRNMGKLDGNTPVSDNDWETVKIGGDTKIQAWIDEQMKGRSCVVVLVGSETASRKWVRYEIEKAWADKKGVLGVRIHGLKDQDENQGTAGENPFDKVKATINGKLVPLSTVVKLYDTPYKTSKNVYDYIKENLADWVEAAIETRGKY